MQVIDFRPLARMSPIKFKDGSVDIGSIRSYFTNVSNSQIAAGLLVLLLLFAGSAALGAFDVFLYLVFGAGGVLVFIVTRRLKAMQTLFWNQFAKANGWQLLASVAETNSVGGPNRLPLCIRQKGHSQKGSQMILGELNGREFYVYTYQYAQGSGETESTYDYTVLCLPAGRVVPHVLALSRKTGIGDITRTGMSDKLELEGDFNNYFDVYVLKGGQVDGLAVLTPDVMQLLVEKYTAYDLEISSNSIFLIAQGDQRLPDKLPQIFQAGLDMLNKLDQNLPNVQPAPLPAAPAAPLSSQPV